LFDIACRIAATQHGHVARRQLLRILPGERARPEVTVPTTNGREQPRIRVHRVAALPELDVETRFGIAETSPARTLLDLSPRLSAQTLTRAGHEAWIRHDTTPAHVDACIARNPRKPGAQRLRAALGDDVTLSKLENCFVALQRDYGLPPARTNIDVKGCHWPEIGLTVELMSYRFHGSRQAFEADIARRRRSNHLAFSYGDVVERAAQTARELAREIECRQRGE
jgi:hypothetical protein